MPEGWEWKHNDNSKTQRSEGKITEVVTEQPRWGRDDALGALDVWNLREIRSNEGKDSGGEKSKGRVRTLALKRRFSL